jgi:hypothetical protein
VLNSRWGRALLVMIVARLGLVAIAQSFPEGGVIVDSRAYLEIAAVIREGDWSALGRGGLHWTPGYPAFLVLAQVVTGTTLVGVGFLQLVLTGVTAILLLWIGDRLGSRCAGMAAAWLYLLSPSASLWSLTVMSESLFAFLVVLALAFLVLGMVEGRSVGWILAGVILAVAALVRPIGLPLVGLWLLVGLAARSPAGARTPARTGVGLFLAGAVFAIAPWVIRNWSVTGVPVFAEVPTNTLVRFNLAYVVADAEGITRDEAASRLADEVDTWGEAVAVIRRYPTVFLSQQAQGILRSLIGVESGVWARQFGYGLERQGSLEVLSTLFHGGPLKAFERVQVLLLDSQTAVLTGLSVLAIAHAGSFYLLGLLGIVAVIRGSRTARLIYLLAGLSAAFMLVSPGAAGQARFRIPAEPYLALFAGAGLCLLIESVTRKGRLQLADVQNPPRPQAADPEGKDG